MKRIILAAAIMLAVPLAASAHGSDAPSGFSGFSTSATQGTAVTGYGNASATAFGNNSFGQSETYGTVTARSAQPCNCGEAGFSTITSQFGAQAFTNGSAGAAGVNFGNSSAQQNNSTLTFGSFGGSGR